MGNKRKTKAPAQGERRMANRSWKSLAQDVGQTPVTPYAWRKRVIPIIKLVVSCAAVLAGAWSVKTLSGKFGDMQRAVLSGIGENPFIQEVYFETDGMLTESFIKSHLDLYEGDPLLEVQIFDLKEELENFEQIRTATVERSISDAFIKIRIVERHPQFRMVVNGGDGKELLLVDREGMSFKAHGYARNTLLRLPSIGGVSLQQEEERFLRIPEIDSLNRVYDRIQEMVPQWFANIDSITIQPKSETSALLGSQLVITTPWCDALILDEESLDTQLISLDRLMNGLVSSGVDLKVRSLNVVDLTVDDRAIVRFEKTDRQAAGLKHTRTRIL